MEKTQSLPAIQYDSIFNRIWASFEESSKQSSKQYEEIHKILNETAKLNEETAKRQEETAKRQEETAKLSKENDKRIKKIAKMQKETYRNFRESTDDFNKRFGDWTNRFGEIAEYMIVPNLLDGFKDIGLIFHKASSNIRVKDHKNDLFFQIDVILENGDKAVLVEIKVKLENDYIKEHIERIEKMRKYSDLRGDKRAFLGAVAGVVIPDNVKNFAFKKGLYVIEPSGKTFNITSPSGKPREW